VTDTYSCNGDDCGSGGYGVTHSISQTDGTTQLVEHGPAPQQVKPLAGMKTHASRREWVRMGKRDASAHKIAC